MKLFPRGMMTAAAGLLIVLCGAAIVLIAVRVEHNPPNPSYRIDWSVAGALVIALGAAMIIFGVRQMKS